MWLLVPVAATVLAALGTWWRARPKRPPRTHEAMQEHDEFLAALARAPRDGKRGSAGG